MYEDLHMARLMALWMAVVVGEPYAVMNGGPKGFAVIRASIALKPRFQEYVIEVFQ